MLHSKERKPLEPVDYYVGDQGWVAERRSDLKSWMVLKSGNRAKRNLLVYSGLGRLDKLIGYISCVTGEFIYKPDWEEEKVL